MADIGLAAKETMTLHAPNKLFLKSSSFSPLSFCVLLPCIWTGLTCPQLWQKGFHVVHSWQIIRGQKTKGRQHALCIYLPLEGKFQQTDGRWRERRAVQHKVKKKCISGCIVFWNKNKEENKEQKKAFSFYSPWLSQVQAGIFIPPGENANHQSRAACYVSV